MGHMLPAAWRCQECATLSDAVDQGRLHVNLTVTMGWGDHEEDNDDEAANDALCQQVAAAAALCSDCVILTHHMQHSSAKLTTDNALETHHPHSRPQSHNSSPTSLVNAAPSSLLLLLRFFLICAQFYWFSFASFASQSTATAFGSASGETAMRWGRCSCGKLRLANG